MTSNAAAPAMGAEIGSGRPISGSERIAELDVLRGFALLGVFIANIVGLGGESFGATRGQLDALPTAAIDQWADAFVFIFVHDKANTLFAFLFGVGFGVQMARLKTVGGEATYLRRLFVLLIFGLFHAIFLFGWDILHVYAAAGFLLFALRGLSDRTMLLAGAALALSGRFVADAAFDLAGVSGPIFERFYGDEAVLGRMAVARAGDVWAWTRETWTLFRFEWIASGMLAGWIAYALGRFLIGAWVARKGWLADAGSRLPAFRRWGRRLLPAGLLGEAAAFALGESGSGALNRLGDALHFAAAPALAAGYVCMVVLAANAPAWAPLTTRMAAVGRTALTNYVTHGLFIGLVLYGFGPGLALAGEIGSTALVAFALGGYALMLAASPPWLGRFAYGPLEWAWRGATYGAPPRWRAA